MTFLPYPDFARSAAVLDRLRLGKQRLEAWQVLRTLLGETSGWRNHPAVNMWRGHEGALARYGVACCVEWRRRGYRDSMLPRLRELMSRLPAAAFTPPAWLGRDDVHSSHRARLVAKQPDFYGAQFAEAAGPCIWPVE